VLFAVELLLVTVTARSLLVVAVAVASGIFVARPLIGSNLSFSVLELAHVTPLTTNWIEVVALIVVGLAVGVLSAVFIRGLYETEDFFDGRFSNPYVAHAIGMFGVGLTMVAFHAWLGYYSVEGVGYATILDVLRGALTDPWVLLALVVGKLAVTFLTLGSGASGGVFSPALFVGAALGGLAGHLASTAGLSVDPVVMALAGMAAMVSGSTGAVLTAVVMTTEMTGDYGAAVPLLLASVVSLAMRRRLSRTSIYTEKLHRRGKWVPTGLQAASVDSVRARDLMGELADVEEAPSIDENESIFTVIASMGSGPILVTRDGTPVGLIDRRAVEHAIERLEAGE
jgi:CIC family chloride channel protein